MKSILNWWNSLDSSTRQSVIVGLVTAIGTAALTTYVPKLLWPVLTKAGIWIRENSYQRLSGLSLFNRWALSRYRRSLRSDLRRIINPWSHQQLVLDNMFVPIKVETKHQLPQLIPGQKQPEMVIDLRDAAREYKRFILVGEPGAGKSTALKSLGISCLEGRLFPDEKETLPVYVELRKYTRSEKPIVDYLPSVFDNYGFPKSSKFIHRALSKGRLFILLDGLDEVSDDDFQLVIERIREFCSAYGLSRLIVSCRSAAYERQLDDLSHGTISLTHFNNIQIVGFLRHWTFPNNKSSVDLMRILNDKPRILSICRNPLMLTIVTSLYAETDYELPSSRAEFYRTCVDAVLKRWDRARQIDRSNRFHASVKLRVLQRIALHLQEQAESGDLQFAELIKFVAEILPEIGISIDLADEILEEIIVNSGLLIYVGPQRLRFAHLTFQEFFAAIELNDRGAASNLLDHFKRDPRRWREVCLLYCGTSTRGNEFVSSLAEHDIITAANCVSDGENIRVELAETLIKRLVKRIQTIKDPEVPLEMVEVNAKRGARINDLLEEVRHEREELLQALSLLATDQRRVWSDAAFDSLRKFFHEAISDFDKSAAIAALANVTNEAAARELVGALQEPETKDVAKRALIQLGVVGLPALKQVLRSSKEQNLIQACLEICAQIPQPEVIDILCPFLDFDSPLIRATTAWALAVLIQDPAIANSLELLKPGELYSPLKNGDPTYVELSKWVWPFPSEEGSSIRNLIATVVKCLSPNVIEDFANRAGASARMDIRIAIPISIQLLKAQPFGELDASFKRTVSVLLTGDEMAWEHPPWLRGSKHQTATALTHALLPSSPSRIFENDAQFLQESWMNVLEKRTEEPFYPTRKVAQLMTAMYLLLGILLTQPSSFFPLLLLLTTLIALTRFWCRKLDQDPLPSLLSVPAGGVIYLRDLAGHHWTSYKQLFFLIACLSFVPAWTIYVGLLGGSFLGQPWSMLAAISFVTTANILFGSSIANRVHHSNPWVSFLRVTPPQVPALIIESGESETVYVSLSSGATLSPTVVNPVTVERAPQRSRLGEIIAIGVLASGLLMAICLISYSSTDLPSIAGGQGNVHNWVGTVGAHVSQGLFQAIGLSAFQLPLLSWLSAWARFTRKRFEMLRLFGGLGLVLAGSTVLALAKFNAPFQWDFPVGGTVGFFIANALTSRFPFIVAWGVSIFALVSCFGWLMNISWLRADGFLNLVLGKASK